MNDQFLVPFDSLNVLPPAPEAVAPASDSIEYDDDAPFIFALSGGSTYNETGSGGVVIGRSSIVAINEPSTGGVVIGSSATIVVTYNTTDSGGCIIGASGLASINVSISGGSVSGGQAVILEKVNLTASGGMVIGGLTDTHNVTETPSGGAVLGGSSTIQERVSIVSSGGAILGGVDRFTYNVIAAGGVLIGATSPNYSHILVSGGVVVGGTLPQIPQRHVLVASGGIIVGETSPYSVYYPPPSGPDAPWINPELALLDDSSETFSDVSYGKQSQYLVVRNFDLGVAADDDILSLDISIKCHATNTLVQTTEVYLVNSTGIISDNLADFLDWPVGTDAVKLFSISDDLRPVLSPAIVNDPTFGVAIRVQNFNNLAIAIAEVDLIDLVVNYEDPVAQRIRIGGNADVLSTAMSYQGNGDVNVDGATASYSIKRYFSERGSIGAVLGGVSDQNAAHNIIASGGVVLGVSAKVTPYMESGSGGAICGGIALVKPYFEFSSGGATVGGRASVRTKMHNVAKGGAAVGGSVYIVFFHYSATGSLTLGGSSYIRSSAWKYTSDGPVTVSGSADVRGSYLGTFMEMGGFNSTVTEFIVNYPIDKNVPQAQILSENISQCDCLQIPLVINFTQNLAVNNKLSQFLFRNNFVLPAIQKLAFNQSNGSWQANLHYRGTSVDGSGSESWDLLYELQCTKVAGGIDIGRTIWKLSMDILRRSTNTYNTRLVVGVLPTAICDTLANELIFKVSYDTQANDAVVDPNSTIYQAILFDNIGLFKNKYWTDNPELVLKVSQAALDSPQIRLNLTSQVLVN